MSLSQGGYVLVSVKTSENHESKRRNQCVQFYSKLITAISNYSVQLNFQAISVALIIMSEEVCTASNEDCRHGKQASWISGAASGTVFAGAIIGQLTMGYAGDMIGRTQAMMLTLSIATTSALLSAVVPYGTPETIYSILIAFRFLLGIGLGGVYPLSASKAAETEMSETSREVSASSADSASPGRNGANAFFWQVPGAMTPWMITYLLSYGSKINWRLILALGAVPTTIVVILTVLEVKASTIKKEISDNNSDTITNTPDVEHNDGYSPDIGELENTTDGTEVPNNSQRSKSEIMQHNSINESTLPDPETARNSTTLWIKLFYTGGTWFLFDICFYGVGLFGGEILDSIGPQRNASDSVSSLESLRNTRYFNT